MYVKRNSQGIVAFSEEPLEGFEKVDPKAVDVQAFLASKSITVGDQRFRDSDSSLIRVIEDLVDLLSAKGILRFTDLPPQAQSKLMERKSMREHIDHLNLIDNPGDDLFDFD